MAVWAYACHRCGDDNTVWYVAVADVNALPTATRIVKVKVGKQWLCARLDKSRQFSVEGLLLRTLIGTAVQSCEHCVDE